MKPSLSDLYTACAALSCCDDFDPSFARPAAGGLANWRIHESPHGTLAIVTDHAAGDYVVLGTSTDAVSQLISRLGTVRVSGIETGEHATIAESMLKDAAALILESRNAR